MRIYIFLFLLFSPQYSYAVNFGCGNYILNGVVRETEDDVLIVINESTISETTIAIDSLDMMKIAPYIDKHIRAEIVVSHAQYGKTLLSSEIKSLNSRIANPLHAKDTYIILKKSSKCKGKK